MSLKTLKFSSIAAAVALGLGLSSMAQAAVVIVTHRPPPPPVTNCVYKPNGTVVCYRTGYPPHVYHTVHKRVCMPSGYCYWQNCTTTPYNGYHCYNASGRVY